MPQRLVPGEAFLHLDLKFRVLRVQEKLSFARKKG
jgi:hypothetical protein